MIKLLFETGGEHKHHFKFMIMIENKVISYYDEVEGKIWGTSLQYLPPDQKSIIKILNSRNTIPNEFIDMLKVPEEEMKEYLSAKDDNELKAFCIKDAEKNKCRLIKEEII